MTYTKLNEKLTGRCANRRKLANNTYAERRGESEIAIRLHNTDILTFRADGSVTVNTGGWQTVTTKDRLNRYLPAPYSIYQRRNVWYWINGGNGLNRGYYANPKHDIHFSDGDTINSHGALVSQAPLDAEEKDRALLKRIDKYAKVCGAALPLQKPSGGDCWGCYFRDDKGHEAMGTEHLVSHMDEGYVVPSLVYHAMKDRGCGPAWYWYAFKADDKSPEQNVFEKIQGDNGMIESARLEVRRCVRRYMRRRLGLAA